jgi:hypothetical protein
MPEDELGVADESGVDIGIPKASVSATVVVSVSRWAADVVREMRSTPFINLMVLSNFCWILSIPARRGQLLIGHGLAARGRVYIASV